MNSYDIFIKLICYGGGVLDYDEDEDQIFVNCEHYMLWLLKDKNMIHLERLNNDGKVESFEINKNNYKNFIITLIK